MASSTTYRLCVSFNTAVRRELNVFFRDIPLLW